MAKSRRHTIEVRLEGEPPADAAAVYVFDSYGAALGRAEVSDGRAAVALSDELSGHPLRFIAGPPLPDDVEPSPSRLRKLGAREQIRIFDPDVSTIFDLPEDIWRGWLLCRCTVRGRVVKSVPQPTGIPVDYPVCGAEVHICEVDRIPKIVWRLPDDTVLRLREELLRRLRPIPVPWPEPPFPEPPFPEPPLPEPPLPDPPPPGPTVVRPFAARVPSDRPIVISASAEPGFATVSRLQLADTAREVRTVLVDLARLYPFWCWFPWLDPFFTYDVDCDWVVTTNEAGEFEATIWHPCSDRPDLYVWVRQHLDTGWKTIYARGPRCDTHWDYPCGSEITIRVTDPDARVCPPPPEIELPDGVDSWVLPMAVGSLEIAGTAGSPSGLGWVLPDGHVSYAGGPANVAPITDAPLGGFLRFRMLHSLDLPRSGAEKYQWSWRRRPVGSETIDWTPMSEPVFRRYQLPGVPPVFPVYTLGPGSDDLYEFRPHHPPAGTWPLTGFTEDLWSAKLNTSALDPGFYQVRVTVHDGSGSAVAPGPGSFQFVVTDTRQGAETYSTRVADPSEIIDDGFVFDVLVDNGQCTAQLEAPALSTGALADSCGFLRYSDPDSTDVTLAFEASHPRNRAWFTLRLARGTGHLPQVSVLGGGGTGAASVPVDTNPGSVWPSAFFSGDGHGSFSGTFPASRLLEECENAAFAMDLYVRAKAHDGTNRLAGYDRHALSAFALAEQPSGGPGGGGPPGGGPPGGGPPSP